jgi:hypothetical protein
MASNWEERAMQQAESMVAAFAVWVLSQESSQAVMEAGEVLKEVLSKLEAGQPVTWGAFQRACRAALWLASLAHTSGFGRVGMVFDAMYEQVCTLAGYEVGGADE